MIWYDMIWYDMIWYDMIWYDMIWYDMIWYDMIWYDMIWWIIICICVEELLVWIQLSVIKIYFSLTIFLYHLLTSLEILNFLYYNPVNFSKGSMESCQWKDSSPAHIFVQHTAKLLCNVRISHLCMELMMMKWGGRVWNCDVHTIYLAQIYIVFTVTVW